MSEQNKKLLMDLWPVAHGHGGIPHECRLIFDLFTEIHKVDLTGYVNWPQSKMLRANRPSKKQKSDERIYDQSQFVFRTTAPRLGKVKDLLEQEGFEPKWARWMRIVNRLRYAYQGHGLPLMPFEKDMFPDFIWSEVFSSSLDAERRPKVSAQPYVYSNSSRSVAHVIAMNTGFHQAIDTRGFDFYFTFANYSWRLPRSTRPIVRYYDTIPLTNPHFFQDMVPTDAHYKTVKFNAEDGRTIFVCDSNPVRAELVRLFPQVEERSIAIPCFVHTGRSTEPSAMSVTEIVRARSSPRISGYDANDAYDIDSERHRTASKNEKARLPDDEYFKLDALGKKAPRTFPRVERYVLSVATLEPRKNYARLARAWRIVKARRPEDQTRLMIVANLGWKVTDSVNTLAPLVKRGHVIHLENVENRELHRLYRDAIGVVSPSLVEGFDYSGIEGMYHGRPIVASDIPVHRSVYEDVPIYFDPYDVEELADRLERLITMPDNDRLELGHRGIKHAERYHRSTVKHQWENFVDELLMKQKYMPKDD
ncbi:MAG: hypothetical protein JWM77_2070 [Rhodospirillales bacterium]|nr:hypothetical protein [Rhodospirillales bacterium]